ncbi:MAG TPA: hypothetical protein VJ810_31870 [Blastocatellia bacterium]|nr:hypothetical protein [Blastocatellia bacterium]
MKNSDSNNWLVPLLAAFAIYLPLSSTSPSPDQQPSGQPQPPVLVQAPPTVAPTPAPGPGRVPGEAARLLCDFFGLEPDLDQKTGMTTEQKSEAENRRGDYCRIKSVSSSKSGARPPISGYDKIDYLIATVPDPKDTRLDYEFDIVLMAIQRAIGSAGYTFDRHWLPWERSKTPPPATAPADPKVAQIATRYLRDPGVILFRNSGENRLLLLFLVGETPTGGIHRVAFQNALRQIEGLPHRVGPDSEEPAKKESLLVLGPTFAASADSLAILLHAWVRGQSPPPGVRIITGSAGAIDKEDFLKEIAAPGVSFHSTIVPTEQAGSEFYKYLCERDREIMLPKDGSSARVQIAVLSEAGSGFGQILRQKLREQNRKAISGSSEKQAPEDANRNEDQRSACSEPKFQPLVLSLTYPLHISQLRVEAAKISPRADATGGLGVKDPNLPLPMGEAGSPGSKDTVPIFSSLETVTMELALREILTAINRERIRYVRVSATDPQDHIFLVREIRKHCPNAMIFMLSGDLLFLHSESNLDFQGALVISSYPLFGLNQLWTYPFEGDQRRTQFSKPTAHGIYNAVLVLLGKEDRMLEYGLPFEQYKDGQARFPAVWLGIVGRKDIWPVRTFNPQFPSDEKSYTFIARNNGSSSAGEEKLLPRLGLSGKYWAPTGAILLLLVGIISLFLSLALLAQLILFWGRSKVDEANPDQWREGRSKLSSAIIEKILKIEREIGEGNGEWWLRPLAWIRRGWLGQVFGDEGFYCHRLDRRIYLMCCCASLLTLSLFISGVALLPAWILWTARKGGALQIGGTRHWVIGVVAGTILVFTLGAFIWLMVGVIAWMISGWRYFRGRIWVLLALGIGAAMITFVMGGLIEVFFGLGMPEKVFFFLRTTELTNGVSILLPGLLIGLAAFLLFFAGLRRLNLAEQMPCLREPGQRPCEAPQFLRFDHERAESFEGLRALEDRVKEMIICPIFREPGVALATLLFLFNWFLFQRNFIPTVEGFWFDWFFKLAFCAVPLVLVWTLMRCFWLWAAVKKLLRRLSWHPLILQYAAGHSEESRFEPLPPVDLMTPAPTYTALSISVRQARSFYDALKLPPEQAETGRIKQLVEEAENKLSLALDSDAKGDWQGALRNRRSSQAAVAELTEPVTGLLEESWRMADASGPNGAEPDAAWRDEGKFLLITHIVAFLQHIFAHLQSLVGLVTMGLLLLLLAAISYPFQPREQLLLFSWVAILASVVVTLFIFLGVSRDKTLSLLAGRTPGKVNVTRDLVFRVLIHGVAPIIALLGAQFPEAVRQIFSWVSAFSGKGN